MLATSLFSLLLLVVAGVLGDALRREWGALGRLPADAHDDALRYARRRVVRRSVANGAIAVVGLMVAAWPWTPREPLWAASYLATLLALTLLIASLAATDALASGRYYRTESKRRLAEQEAELLAAIQEARR